MLPTDMQSHSGPWLFFVKASFASALLAMAAGVFLMPGDLMIKGYFALCALFLVSATINLTKTLRDDHESQRLINRISDAKAQKMIQELSE